MRWAHLGLVIFWVLISIPGMLFWKEAVWFVVAMSLYANFEASFAAFLSSPKKERTRTKLQTVNLSHTGSFARVVRERSAKSRTPVQFR